MSNPYFESEKSAEECLNSVGIRCNFFTLDGERCATVNMVRESTEIATSTIRKTFVDLRRVECLWEVSDRDDLAEVAHLMGVKDSRAIASISSRKKMYLLTPRGVLLLILSSRRIVKRTPTLGVIRQLMRLHGLPNESNLQKGLTSLVDLLLSHAEAAQETVESTVEDALEAESPLPAEPLRPHLPAVKPTPSHVDPRWSNHRVAYVDASVLPDYHVLGGRTGLAAWHPATGIAVLESMQKPLWNTAAEMAAARLAVESFDSVQTVLTDCNTSVDVFRKALKNYQACNRMPSPLDWTTTLGVAIEKGISLDWIARDLNDVADKLANLAATQLLNGTYKVDIDPPYFNPQTPTSVRVSISLLESRSIAGMGDPVAMARSEIKSLSEQVMIWEEAARMGRLRIEEVGMNLQDMLRGQEATRRYLEGAKDSPVNKMLAIAEQRSA